MMNGFIKISAYESAVIYGGRSESVARAVEIVSQYIGVFAKLIYLTAKRGPQAIAGQMASGYYPKF